MLRFSERLRWDPPPNPFSEILERKRAAREPLLDLTVSNPTEVLPEYPHAAIHDALCGVKDFRYRPHPLGAASARETIAPLYFSPGFSLAPERIALTASTSEAYSVLFKLLCNPGDEVLVPSPSYPLFDYLARAENLSPKPYKLGYDGSWFIDFESLSEALSQRSRAIILVNPNNPTGSFLKKTEWELLARIALDRSLPLISDEVFADFEFGGREGRVRTLVGRDESALSFSLGGLSKSAGMPQLKLAWIVVNGPAAERRAAVAGLELLLDTYLSVNTPVQAALPALLAAGQSIADSLRERTAANLAGLEEILAGGPIHLLHNEGGWSAVLQFPHTLSEEEWITRALTTHNVLLHPGYFYDMPHGAYGVVSLITETAPFRTGIQRLRELTA